MVITHVPHFYENMKNCLQLGHFDYFTETFSYSHNYLSCQMLINLLDISQKRLMKLQSDAQILGSCGDKNMQYSLLEDSKYYINILKTLYDTLEQRSSQKVNDEENKQQTSFMKKSRSFLLNIFY
jgi:hypothetical protein